MRYVAVAGAERVGDGGRVAVGWRVRVLGDLARGEGCVRGVLGRKGQRV